MALDIWEEGKERFTLEVHVYTIDCKPKISQCGVFGEGVAIMEDPEQLPVVIHVCPGDGVELAVDKIIKN